MTNIEVMKLIYIVEDHQVIREGVRKYLQLSGYQVLTFANLVSAREAFRIKKADLLIQDVMLPDGNGFEFVEQLRKTCDVPVIFMTALVSEEDRIRGFELGADDYITKPFSPKELVLRVNALFRRIEVGNVKRAQSGKLVLKVGDSRMFFDSNEHSLKINGQEIVLTSAEWRIMEYFISNAGQTLSRADILSRCFDYHSQSYERIADTHIKNLRAKLGQGQWIETVRGYGYRFAGYVVDSSESAPEA